MNMHVEGLMRIATRQVLLILGGGIMGPYISYGSIAPLKMVYTV